MSLEYILTGNHRPERRAPNRAERRRERGREPTNMSIGTYFSNFLLRITTPDPKMIDQLPDDCSSLSEPAAIMETAFWPFMCGHDDGVAIIHTHDHRRSLRKNRQRSKDSLINRNIVLNNEDSQPYTIDYNLTGLTCDSSDNANGINYLTEAVQQITITNDSSSMPPKPSQIESSAHPPPRPRSFKLRVGTMKVRVGIGADVMAAEPGPGKELPSTPVRANQGPDKFRGGPCTPPTAPNTPASADKHYARSSADAGWHQSKGRKMSKRRTTRLRDLITSIRKKPEEVFLVDDGGNGEAEIMYIPETAGSF